MSIHRLKFRVFVSFIRIYLHFSFGTSLIIVFFNISSLHILSIFYLSGLRCLCVCMCTRMYILVIYRLQALYYFVRMSIRMCIRLVCPFPTLSLSISPLYFSFSISCISQAMPRLSTQIGLFSISMPSTTNNVPCMIFPTSTLITVLRGSPLCLMRIIGQLPD